MVCTVRISCQRAWKSKVYFDFHLIGHHVWSKELPSDPTSRIPYFRRLAVIRTRYRAAGTHWSDTMQMTDTWLRNQARNSEEATHDLIDAMVVAEKRLYPSPEVRERLAQEEEEQRKSAAVAATMTTDSILFSNQEEDLAWLNFI